MIAAIGVDQALEEGVTVQQLVACHKRNIQYAQEERDPDRRKRYFAVADALLVTATKVAKIRGETL